MTDEEAIQLKQAFVDLQEAFLNLKEVVAQKDRRIEEMEGCKFWNYVGLPLLW